MEKAEIEAVISDFTARQHWMHNIGLPHGLFTVSGHDYNLGIADDEDTRSQKIRRLQRSGSKEGLLCAMDLKGKRVLDVACGEGKYSFAVADQAASILGFDIDDLRIEKANFIRSLGDLPNVEFQVLDLYSDEFAALPGFDLAICFGLIHRLPDPFNFINALAPKTEAILFEWIVAPPMMDQDVSWAYHRPGGLYEWQNARDNFEAKEVASKGRGGGGVNRASYWYPSFGAVEAICQRSGFNHFIRFSREAGYPDHSKQPDKLSRRVMLLASKKPQSLMGQASRKGLVKVTIPKSGEQQNGSARRLGRSILQGGLLMGRPLSLDTAKWFARAGSRRVKAKATAWLSRIHSTKKDN